MIKRIVLFYLLLGSVFAVNDNVGTSVANFLKIGVGSRAEAMGGAYTAQVMDVSALYWNPSGLAFITGPEVMFSQTQWFADINHIFAGIAWPVSPRFGSLGLSIISLTMEDLEETTEEQPHGTGRTFPASDISIGAGYARKISDRFSVGLHAKYIQETISFSQARAFAIDIGTRYVTGFMGMKVGMAVTNFGSEMTMRGTDLIFKKTDPYPDIGSNPNINSRLETKAWPLPVAVRVGISWDPIGPTGGFRTNALSVTVNADYFDPRDFKPYYNVGFETSIMNMLFLRAGVVNRFAVNLEYDIGEGAMKLVESDSFFADYEQLFTFGFGLEHKIPFTNTLISADYAYSELGILKGVHRYTISLSF